MGFIPILFESFEVVIIIGLLVMLLLMFGAVTYLKGTIRIFQKSIFIILSKITLMSIRRNTWRKKRQQQSN